MKIFAALFRLDIMPKCILSLLILIVFHMPVAIAHEQALDHFPDKIRQTISDDIQSGRFDRALERLQKLFDETSDNKTRFLLAMDMGEISTQTGQPRKAAEYLSTALDIPLDNIPSDAIDHVWYLYTEAIYAANNKKKAAIIAQNWAHFRELWLGSDDSATLQAFVKQSFFMEEAGDVTGAMVVREKALTKLRAVNFHDYSMALNNLAIRLQNSGHMETASQTFLLLLTAISNQPESVFLGITYFNLAVLERDKLQFDKAIDYHRKAIDILEHTGGLNDTRTIIAYDGMGQTYDVAGHPAAALLFLREAYQRSMKAGLDNNQFMTTTNNLANVYRTIKQPDKAYEMDKKAYSWRVQNLGATHPDTQTSLYNMALDLFELGDFKTAFETFQHMIAQRQNAYGAKHPDTQLAQKMFYALFGKHDTATMPTLPDNADASAYNADLAFALAQATAREGNCQKAIQYLNKSSLWSDMIYGPLDPISIYRLKRAVYALSYETDGAVDAYIKLEQRLRQWQRRELFATSDPFIIDQIAKSTHEDISRIFTFALHASLKDPKATLLIETIAHEWKTPISMERQFLLQQHNALTSDDKERLKTIDALRVQLYQSQDPVEKAKFQRDLTINESKLTDRLSTLRTQMDVQKNTGQQQADKDRALPIYADEAIIDFIIINSKMSDNAEMQDYLFAIITLGSDKSFVHVLQSAHSIQAMLSEQSQIDSSSGNESLRKFYDILLAPLEKNLKDIRHIYIVPDGELALVPFDSLLDKNNQPFFMKRDVTIARNRSAIDSMRKTPSIKDTTALLIGNVSYPEHMLLAPLPYTKIETQAAHELLDKKSAKTIWLGGSDANERNIYKESRNKTIIHFATHGFFKPDSTTQDDPLERSGIILSAPTQMTKQDNPDNDGILHASEIMHWPLQNTELVIVSACETADGDISYGDGILGFSSALAAAGAKRSLLARKQVYDDQASIFIIRFYEYVANGFSYEQAINAVKREVYRHELPHVSLETATAFVLIEN